MYECRSGRFRPQFQTRRKLSQQGNIRITRFDKAVDLEMQKYNKNVHYECVHIPIGWRLSQEKISNWRNFPIKEIQA